MNKAIIFLIATAVFSFDSPLCYAITVSKKVVLLMNDIYSYKIDFTDINEVGNWQVINDGVMGGLSKGQMIFTDDVSVFNGNISLENNGGFSSVYRQIEPLPKGLDVVEIDIHGDGLVY